MRNTLLEFVTVAALVINFVLWMFVSLLSDVLVIVAGALERLAAVGNQSHSELIDFYTKHKFENDSNS